MFKLAESRASRRGVYCGEEGLCLGSVPLIEPDAYGRYRVRPSGEIEAPLAAAYEARRRSRIAFELKNIAAELQQGDVVLAQIRALRLRLAEVLENRSERLARTEKLLKANFNPDEPRDERGRWTDSGDAGNTEPARDAGNIVPIRFDESSPAAASGSLRSWESQPNSDFRNRLQLRKRPQTSQIPATALRGRFGPLGASGSVKG